jgi:hypothetical protein
MEGAIVQKYYVSYLCNNRKAPALAFGPFMLLRRCGACRHKLYGKLRDLLGEKTRKQ